MTNLNPDLVSFLRIATAFFCFMPFLHILNLSKKSIFNYIVLGAIQYGLMQAFYIRAYSYLNANEVVLFTAMTPIYVNVINGLYERKILLANLFISLIAFLAIALIYYRQENSNLIRGILLVQLADFCFAFGQITYKKLKQQQPNIKDIDVFGLMFLGALFITFAATTFSGGWNSLSQISLNQFWVIIYLGSVSSGVCFFLWNKGMLLVNNATLAVFNNLKIPLGILISIIVFKENVSIFRVGFSLFIILACIITQERLVKHRQSNFDCVTK